MAVTAKFYGKAIEGQWSATAARRVDWAGDTIKVALFKEAFEFKQDEHDFFDDISSNEITGTGYTAGGKALGSKSVEYDAASNETRLKAANTEWTGASFSAFKAVVYKDTGTPSTSPLLGEIDFGGENKVTSGTFTIEWDATHGVFKITEEA